MRRLAAIIGIGAAGLSLAGGHNGPANIDRGRLLEASHHPEEWLTTGGDFGKTHFSRLGAINVSTVSRLGYAWGYETGTNRGLEATPIVVDNVMYTSGVAGRAYALDAATGKQIWRFEPRVNPAVQRSTCCDQVNRGVAVWHGRVYVSALDGILYALNAATGKVLWKADTITDRTRGYSSTGAPEVAGNVVVIGNAGGDFDARGYITAYDLKTGLQAWRFFTVPGDPQKPIENADLAIAAKTWDAHSRWDVGGGGNVWDGMTYDPQLNLLYVATGNGEMWEHLKRSPNGGDNLFTCSLLALNPDTGRLVWHYQETPGDQWDYDSDAPIVLTTMSIAGRERQVLMHAPKNGFFYVLDRTSGELLSAKPYVPVNWASEIDLKTGRPLLNPAADYASRPKLVFPSPVGGHLWNPMAYSPSTGLVYLPAIEGGSVMYDLGVNPDRQPGLTNVDVGLAILNSPEDLASLPPAVKIALGRPPADSLDLHRRAYLRAWDPVAQREVWKVLTVGGWDHAGVLATQGGLVFQGSVDGHLRAYDARSGRLLADVDTGSSIIAAPMSYAVDGVQYVAVMAAAGGGYWPVPHPENAAYKYGNSGRILAFRLDGTTTPKPPPLPPIELIPQPPPQTESVAVVQRGQILYLTHCALCHVNAARTEGADLTRLSAGVHAAFDDIVFGGLLREQGMPQWSDVLSKGDVHAIHAWVIKMSEDAYQAQQSKTAPTQALEGPG